MPLGSLTLTLSLLASTGSASASASATSVAAEVATASAAASRAAASLEPTCHTYVPPRSWVAVRSIPTARPIDAVALPTSEAERLAWYFEVCDPAFRSLASTATTALDLATRSASVAVQAQRVAETLAKAPPLPPPTSAELSASFWRGTALGVGGVVLLGAATALLVAVLQ
jgi:hypothetical protein